MNEPTPPRGSASRRTFLTALGVATAAVGVSSPLANGAAGTASQAAAVAAGHRPRTDLPLNFEPYQGIQHDLVRQADGGPATAEPKLRHIYAAAPDTLAIVVDAQFIVAFPVEKYVAQPGDRVERSRLVPYGPNGEHSWARGRELFRDGKSLGNLAGPDNNLYLWPHRRLMGQELDLARADAKASYALDSEDDTGYGSATEPLEVFRKSKPQMAEWAMTDNGLVENVSTARHEIYLKLPRALKPGATYRLRLAAGSPLGPELRFTFDDRRLRTEALHVNQVGYHPEEKDKIAMMAMWLGTGGDAALSSLRRFHLVEARSGATVFSGRVRVRQDAVPGKITPIYPAKDSDSAAMPVTTYALDFSSFDRPGAYRVWVPGLGCSFPFRIDRRVWEEAAKVSAHGYLNQRSGIKLGPPHTDFRVARALHPDDGFKVHSTDPAVFFDPVRFPAKSGEGNPFKRIQASILLDTHNPDAWGGWHDAGDYDRNIGGQNHTRGVHAMLDLYESNPRYFERLRLNLPESGNHIPDLVNEALWCMELFRRIQYADGGIPSSVESIEHPDEPGFAHGMPTAVTPSTPQVSYAYAAAAAQLSLVLRRYDPRLSATYRASATRAMEWAVANAQVPDIFHTSHFPRDETQNLAAAWMYRLTGESRWHDLFKESLARIHPDGDLRLDRFSYSGPWGLGVYATLPVSMVDEDLQARAIETIAAHGDQAAATVDNSPVMLIATPRDWEDRLGEPYPLVLAHRVTGDGKYVRALAQMAQFGLGRNPHNAGFTGGLGSRQVVSFHLQAYFTGQRIPKGLSAAGPLHQSTWGAQHAKAALAPRIHPAWEQWPWAESVFDIRHWTFTEHTVGGVMANQLLMRGYLAQEHGNRH
ncbi:glycoside hydrolase family 9 protein [Streptomyces sp. NPDC006624]|uniref:glycoside hydrolase family 9 protein n=1 Tax=Streptomyces sp. NPDC006624 TaxID=3154892 RepID=UPI0033B52A22